MDKAAYFFGTDSTIHQAIAFFRKFSDWVFFFLVMVDFYFFSFIHEKKTNLSGNMSLFNDDEYLSLSSSFSVELARIAINGVARR